MAGAVLIATFSGLCGGKNESTFLQQDIRLVIWVFS